MAENFPKSKLKRKAASCEELQSDTSSGGTPRRGHTTLLSNNRTAKTDGSVVPTAAWWNRQQLPSVESLWAFTLKSALLYLENQHWDLVPDLPHPSAGRDTALKPDERGWCDLRSEVPPFPEPSPPSLRTSWSSDPLRLSSSQQNLSAQAKLVPDPPDRQLSSDSRQSPHCKRMSPQPLKERQQLSYHRWEEAASSAGPSSTSGEETGSVSRQLLTDQVKMSDNPASLQKEGENKEEVEDEEDDQVQRSVTGDGGPAAGRGGQRLQSCPMCLLVFPLGFTQMDCDGHLAQCLSEMNVDMTW